MECVAQEKQRPRSKGLPEDHRIETSGQMEGQGLEKSPPVVFEAVKVPIAPVSPGFAPLDSLQGDDELVYPVPDSVPVLLNLDADYDSRPFLNDGFVSNGRATILADSGASSSLVSKQWCLQHHVHAQACHSYGRLADSSPFSVIGKLSRALLRLDAFPVNHDFLVAD
jgi:hypothetical protein